MFRFSAYVEHVYPSGGLYRHVLVESISWEHHKFAWLGVDH